jgi:hypothetical protein
MNPRNFSKENKVERVEAATSAGTADVDSAVVDLAGFSGVAFVVCSQAITTSGTAEIKVQHGDESNLSDAEDVDGLTITVADDDDNQTFVLDLSRPTKRYARLYIDRATANSAWSEILAFKYGAELKPVDNDVDGTITSDLVAVGESE